MFFHKPHQGAVANEAHLHALHQPRAQLAVGQRAQHANIGKHRPRLQKIPDKILALRQVHAHLAAHARVDLCEKRRRHLHIFDPAHEHRGHKSAHVAHNPAAKGNQQASPVAPRTHHLAQSTAPRWPWSCAVRPAAETAQSAAEFSPLRTMRKTPRSTAPKSPAKSKQKPAAVAVPPPVQTAAQASPATRSPQTRHTSPKVSQPVSSAQ